MSFSTTALPTLVTTRLLSSVCCACLRETLPNSAGGAAVVQIGAGFAPHHAVAHSHLDHGGINFYAVVNGDAVDVYRLSFFRHPHGFDGRTPACGKTPLQAVRTFRRSEHALRNTFRIPPPCRRAPVTTLPPSTSKQYQPPSFISPEKRALPNSLLTSRSACSCESTFWGA